MNIVIFGHKQHGKDTVCEYIAKKLGLSFISSSQFALDTFLFEKMKNEFGYTTKEECFADRVNHREYWFNEIRAYNTPDGTRMGREIFQKYHIYCGIRNDEEFYALKQANLIELAVWIDASARKPKESKDSMKLTEADADLIITNNGTLEELHAKIDRILDFLLL